MTTKLQARFGSFLALCALLTTPGAAEAGKRALLVGVSVYKSPNIPTLAAIPTDLAFMEQELREVYGFGDNIRMLKDQQATLQNVKDAFQGWLVQGTAPGDTVLFYFSGHGTQVPDLNKDETDDRWDEALVLYDTEQVKSREGARNVLIDDDIDALLDQLADRQVILITDACHSGTIHRSLGDPPLPDKGMPPFGGVDDEDEEFGASSSAPPAAAQQKHAQAVDRSRSNVIVLAAAQSNEKATQTYLPGEERAVSAFTYGLFRGLSGEADGVGGEKDGQVSYQELLKYSGKVINEVGKKHTPFVDPPLFSQPLQQPAFGQQMVAAAAAAGQAAAVQKPAAAGPQEPLLISLRTVGDCPTVDPAALSGTLGQLTYVKLVGAEAKRHAELQLTCQGSALQAQLVQVADIKHPVRSLRADGSGKVAPESIRQALADDLETAYVSVNLRQLNQPDQGSKLELWVESAEGATERKTFRFGETPQFKVRSSKDGHLYLFVINSAGQMALLFPNRWQSSPMIEANQVFTIPEIEVTPPEGSDLLKAVLFNEPVELPGLDLGRLGTEGFLMVTPTGAMQTSVARSIVDHLYKLCQPGQTNWNTATLQTWAVAK